MALDEQVLGELKESLLAEKKRIEAELGRFAHKTSEGDFASTFPDDLGDEKGENASEVEEYTDRLGVEQSLEAQLQDITDALGRMEAGTYGVDEETGEAIAMDRLRAYPAARTNVR